MKKNILFQFMMIVVLGISIVSFASCDKDDDDNKTSNALKLNPTQVTIAPGATATVSVGADRKSTRLNSSH